jgi:hypothetical protein
MNGGLTKNFSAVLAERAEDLAKAGDPELVKEIITESKTEAKRRTPIFKNDRLIYRITVSVLGLCVLSVIYVQYQLAIPPGNANEIPDGIIAIGSAAIGALAGLLAPTGSENDDES